MIISRRALQVSYRSFCAVALLLGAVGCSRHVRLENPHTAPGARYTCAAGRECVPATADVPAELNQSGTAFVILPTQCAGRIHKIVVLNADSSEPEVDVTCAPIEDEGSGPIEEMK
ncbi:MAG TPA: hypothetical protein VM686_27330 [Polyangiaceae bacterium]|nr:hypothetical protein [Polyangiaceae bacterium]